MSHYDGIDMGAEEGRAQVFHVNDDVEEGK